MKGLRYGRGALFVLMLALGGAARQDQESPVRPFAVTARRYAFAPLRIEVFQDDLVRIELSTEDIPHSFTVDAYRIAKRVNPGHPTSFEFRADQVGTFPFYCNLKIDDGCREMRGELVVKPRRQPREITDLRP
jgi:heme/copper-type cytochrome/quinol oxidase subunit 2